MYAAGAVYKLHYHWPEWAPGRSNVLASIRNPSAPLEPPRLFNVQDDPREDHPLDTTIEPYKGIAKLIEEAKNKHLEGTKSTPPKQNPNFFIEIAKFHRLPFWEYGWQRLRTYWS
jgi:hypothetical protein